MNIPPGRLDYDDDDYNPFSWGSGSIYILTTKPMSAGIRRPIGFLADIDAPVEEWPAPRSKAKKETE